MIPNRFLSKDSYQFLLWKQFFCGNDNSFTGLATDTTDIDNSRATEVPHSIQESGSTLYRFVVRELGERERGREEAADICDGYIYYYKQLTYIVLCIGRLLSNWFVFKIGRRVTQGVG